MRFNNAGANERESIVNFDALRRLSSRLTLAAAAAISSVILGSCGGGGAATNAEQNGALQLLPSAASLYAGVAYNFQIAGGRPPYLLSSSEPVLLPVPSRVEGHTFQLVANNPGVIDANLPPDSLPIRSVVITVRDALGTVFATATQNGITVGQNFLTGYGITFTSDCGSGDACAGADALIRMRAVTNGSIYGNRPFRFCVNRGNFQFVIPEVPSNVPETLVNCVDTVSDHTGMVTARLRVPQSASSQTATLRLIDVGTGAYVDEVFTISASSVSGTLTILPNDFQFAGPRQGVCGTGTGEFLVFDGQAPYSALSSNPNVTVTPDSTGANPGRFQLQAANPTVCLTAATIVVTDALNRRATVTVTTTEGSATNPAMVVSPTTVSLGDICGLTASVTAVGGSGAFSANSTHPRLGVSVSGNTVSIRRLTGDPAPLVAYPTTGTVSITDGSNVATVTVNGVAAICP
jgi:hypothetical protein